MSVYRINKTKNFTVMSNYHLRDMNISLKARGLLSTMLSLSENWIYSITGLAAICKEQETAVKSALQELKKAGYVKVTKKMPDMTDTGRIEYVYDIFEVPQSVKQEVEKQGVEILHVEIQDVENPTLRNKDERSTDVRSTDNNKERKKEAKTYDEILQAVPDEELRNLYYEYIKMRKLIKSPMTDRALTMLINKVDELEQSVERKKKLLENAIINNWKSVYPLKEKPHDNDDNYFLKVARGEIE